MTRHGARTGETGWVVEQENRLLRAPDIPVPGAR